MENERDGKRERQRVREMESDKDTKREIETHTEREKDEYRKWENSRCSYVFGCPAGIQKLKVHKFSTINT